MVSLHLTSEKGKRFRLVAWIAIAGPVEKLEPDHHGRLVDLSVHFYRRETRRNAEGIEFGPRAFPGCSFQIGVNSFFGGV